MTNLLRSAQNAMPTTELEDIAKVLAKYNLGICVPHMHDHGSGETVSLPSGLVSCERNRQVTFEIAESEQVKSMQPVAWRWNGRELELCAACCTVGTDD